MKKLIETLVWVSIVLLVIWFAFASRPFRPSGSSLSNQPAASFTLPDLAGQSVEFEQFRQGKKVLLFFWSTWCPHCRDKIVRLPQMSKYLADQNVEILLINVGEPVEKAKQYLVNMKVNANTLLDQQSKVFSSDYHGVGLPWFVLVDEKGMIQAADFDVPDL